MWHVTHGGGRKFSQNFSSPAFTVCDRQCLEDSELKDDSKIELIILLMKKLQPQLHQVCLQKNLYQNYWSPYSTFLKGYLSPYSPVVWSANRKEAHTFWVP